MLLSLVLDGCFRGSGPFLSRADSWIDWCGQRTVSKRFIRKSSASKHSNTSTIVLGNEDRPRRDLWTMTPFLFKTYSLYPFFIDVKSLEMFCCSSFSASRLNVSLYFSSGFFDIAASVCFSGILSSLPEHSLNFITILCYITNTIGLITRRSSRPTQVGYLYLIIISYGVSYTQIIF